MERDLDNFEDDTDLINVDGTKVKLSGKVLKVIFEKNMFNFTGYYFVHFV
jgi:hypothetical protein